MGMVVLTMNIAPSRRLSLLSVTQTPFSCRNGLLKAVNKVETAEFGPFDVEGVWSIV